MPVKSLSIAERLTTMVTEAGVHWCICSIFPPSSDRSHGCPPESRSRSDVLFCSVSARVNGVSAIKQMPADRRHLCDTVLDAITAFCHRCRQRARNGNPRDCHFKHIKVAHLPNKITYSALCLHNWDLNNDHLYSYQWPMGSCWSTGGIQQVT